MANSSRCQVATARPMEKGFLFEEEAWAPWPPEGPLALSYLRNSFLPEDVKMMWHVSPLSPFAPFSCSQGSLVSHTLTKDFLRLYQAIFLRYKKGIKTKQTTPTIPQSPCAACAQSLSHVQLFATCQAPLSMGFCRRESWSGWPFPSLGDLPDPGIKPASRHDLPFFAHSLIRVQFPRGLRDLCHCSRLNAEHTDIPVVFC